MKISILTLFPNMFDGPFNHSILKRAQDKKLLHIEFIDIRKFGIGKHKIVDDTPYGGGVGMVLRADVVVNTIEYARCKESQKCTEQVILLDAAGTPFKQDLAYTLSTYEHLILVCGHYEGYDDRIRNFVDAEISIGDYVLTGGEIPAMVVTDVVSRLLPTVLGKDESSISESFQKTTLNDRSIHVLEYPQYTRPQEFRNVSVPDILLSGDHKKIEAWRENEAMKRTKIRRSDLLQTK